MDKTQRRRRLPPRRAHSRACGLARSRCAASRTRENRARLEISPPRERQTAREYRAYTRAMHRSARGGEAREGGRNMKRRQSQKDKELADNARLLRAWKRFHREERDVALSGPHAVTLAELFRMFSAIEHVTPAQLIGFIGT